VFVAGFVSGLIMWRNGTLHEKWTLVEGYGKDLMLSVEAYVYANMPFCIACLAGLAGVIITAFVVQWFTRRDVEREIAWDLIGPYPLHADLATAREKLRQALPDGLPSGQVADETQRGLFEDVEWAEEGLREGVPDAKVRLRRLCRLALLEGYGRQAASKSKVSALFDRISRLLNFDQLTSDLSPAVTPADSAEIVSAPEDAGAEDPARDAES
jgi:hypothetical protein